MNPRVLMKSVLVLSTAFMPLHADAQTFTTRPMALVCPYAPGGMCDVIPRMLAPLMSQAMGTSIVVENRPGANGGIGAAAVAKAEPNGSTILMAPTGVLSTNQWLYKQLPYSPEKDFQAITNAAITPHVLVVHPSFPAKTLKELIAFAKAAPGSLTFASSGSGSISHLCGELLKSAAGIDIVHVPYKGPGPAAQDLLAGRVTMMCEALSNVSANVRNGSLRAIAIASKTRHRILPDVPTGIESGLPEFEASIWFGFVAPAGVPKPVIDSLNAYFVKALRNPVVVERLEGLGLTIVADSPEEFGNFITLESAKWRKVVRDSGAKVD